MLRKFLVLALLGVGTIYGANEGRIVSIAFGGASDPHHPDVVQIAIEGGYNYTGCDQTFAAIRKTENHLISAALTAYSIGAKVLVVLNPNDTYFNDTPKRCTISRLSIVNN